MVVISGLLFGFNTAIMNGVLLFLQRQFALNNLETEVAAGDLLLGCLLGAAGASLIGDRLGRRKALLLTASGGMTLSLAVLVWASEGAAFRPSCCWLALFFMLAHSHLEGACTLGGNL